MSTAPVKSKPLHNFPLSFLKWGGTATSNAHAAAPAPASNNHRSRRPDHDHRSPRLGSRLSRTNRYAPSHSPTNHHHQSPPLRNNDGAAGEEEVAVAEAVVAAAEEEAVQKPWNLRPRKPAVPIGGGASRCGNVEAHEAGVSVNGEAAKCSSEKRKLWIALSRDEIEEDIFVMTGSRPNRRPRKRPKNVQKQMDSVFPGLWLVGITADAYKVEDAPATPAKR